MELNNLITLLQTLEQEPGIYNYIVDPKDQDIDSAALMINERYFDIENPLHELTFEEYVKAMQSINDKVSEALQQFVFIDIGEWKVNEENVKLLKDNGYEIFEQHDNPKRNWMTHYWMIRLCNGTPASFVFQFA